MIGRQGEGLCPYPRGLSDQNPRVSFPVGIQESHIS